MKTKNVLRKIILSIFALAVAIPSIYLGQSLVNSATITANAATEETPSFLDVKMQTKETTEGYDVRFVSSVDKLEGYQQVGFVLTFNETTYATKTNTVYTRIGATLDNLDYKYSPKVVDVNSEYFITAVFHVAAADIENDMTVKAFYVPTGVEATAANRTYGEERVLSLSDTNKNQISVRVDKELELGATYHVLVGELTGTATALNKHNMRIVLDNIAEGVVADKATLPSVSTVTLYDPDAAELTEVATGSYRNLYSAGTNDTTAFDNYSSEDKFIIASQADMYGFSVISNQEGKTFSNKAVYMVADVALNDVKKVDWTTGTANEGYTLTSMGPIGKSGSLFNGTFDGQGHTISGVYIKTTDRTYTGLFETLYDDAVVRNFKLVDSYIESAKTNGKRNGTGSIAGRNDGTIDSVYSSATVKNSKQMTGGIAGMVTRNAKNKFINCWFDGIISVNTQSCGGILGGGYTMPATLEHCLFTGTIKAGKSSTEIGGIYGYSQSSNDNTTVRTVKIIDCLNAGTIEVTEGAANIGTIAGDVHSTVELTMENSYGVNENGFANNLIGTAIDNEKRITNTGSSIITLANLQGYRAADNTTLDFETSWVLQYENSPRLAAFDENEVDVAWYKANPTATEYTISTAEELLGFNDLCKDTDYFAGKTVKLGADIAVNANWTASVDAAAPKLEWKPKDFSGHFVGQGHTISGLYAKETSHVGFFSRMNDGSTVTNLKITNSYFEGTTSNKDLRCPVGSVTGQCGGIIDTVYSDAILKNSGAMMVGGIAGMTHEGTDIAIKNCWFDGDIVGRYSMGGILGGSYQTAATVEHCLNTGSITLSGNAYYAGGIIGHLQNTGSNVRLEDCLNAGTFDYNKKTCAGLGTLAGRGNQSSALTVVNSYGVEEFAPVLYAQKDGTSTITNTGNTSAVRYLADLNGYGAYQWTKLDFEDVDETGEDQAYWVLKDGKIPALAIFDTTDLDLETAKTKLDHTWYNLENKENLVIDTKEELLSFNEICDKTRNYFAGHTVYLGADIDLNEGWTASATLQEGGTQWTPIAQFGGTFNGEYDGQMHTIRGLYVATTGANTGLFGIINSGATVQNLKLRNSYITSTKGSMGSIAGKNHGTISTVYSDADIISTVTGNAAAIGGIAGGVNVSTGANAFENCWFDGSITVAGKACGGILGWSGGSVVSINHCLNTGTLTTSISSAQLGGLMGFIQESSAVTIEDSLNAGVSGANKSQIGAIVGGIQADATNINNSLTVKNTYGLDSFGHSRYSIGWSGQKDADTGLNFTYGETTTNVTASNPTNGAVSKSDFYNELKELDSNYWLAKENSTPILKSFANLIVADTNWYNTTDTEFKILDTQQFLGFSKLGAGNNFSGKKIYLATDVTLNDGNASDWAKVVPETVWTPISKFNGEFNGEYAGQTHTISGLYIKSEKQVGMFSVMDKASTVSNLKITNSYIEGTLTGNRYGVGSVVGQCWGDIDTVYSDAIIVNAGTMTGGIAGFAYNTDTTAEVVITNCWFDGEILSSNQACGGIIGGSYITNTTISHCLNTGTLTSTYHVDGKGNQIGGIFGYISGSETVGSTVKITDCLNVGICTDNKLPQVGAFVGAIQADHAKGRDNQLTIEKSYGISGFDYGDDAVGYQDPEDSTSVTIANSDVTAKGNLVGDGAANLDFVNYWTSRNTSTPILTSFVGEYQEVEGWLLDTLPAYETESATLSKALYSSGAYVSTYAAQAEIDNADGKETKMQSVDGTTADEVVVYADKLTSNDYTLESQTTMENNTFYRFKKDNNRVYVNYYGNTGRATIELDESGNPFPFEEGVSYNKADTHTADTEYYLYALRMAEKRSNDTTVYPTNGAAMVVKCADNSIIMIDGGAAEQMNSVAEQTRLYNFLKEITGQSEVDNAVINVSAWYISHYDTDHCAGFSEVLLKNPKRYNVQRVISNLPDEKAVLKDDDTVIKTGLASIVSKVKSAISASEKAHSTTCREVKLRTGDELTICGVKLSTLFTHTDYANADGLCIPANNALFNATSTIAQFTSPEGMKMLVTGDMFDDTETILCKNFSATTLNTDILQQPHHNSTDVQEIYDRASAQIMFFTQRRTIVDIKWNYDYSEYQTAQKAKRACEEYYCGGSETVGFKWDSASSKAAVIDGYPITLTY